MTRVEASAILADRAKQVDGDVVSRQHPDITYAVSFRVEMEFEGGNIAITGYYNRENKKFSLNMFRPGERPFVRLCMESEHHNPSCSDAGDPHLHEWDDDNGDKIAGAVAFSVDGELSDIWRAFCNWANITHNGIFESQPPRQTGLFE